MSGTTRILGFASSAVAALGLGVWLLAGAGSRGTSPWPATIERPAPPPAGVGPTAPPMVGRQPTATVLDARRAFSASPGQQFLYRLGARWRTRMEQGAKDPQGIEWRLEGALPNRLTLDLSATMEVLILAHEEETDTFLVRFRLAGLRVVANQDGGHASPEGALFRGDSFARLGADGRILGFAFAEDVSPKARELLAALFSMSHQFVAREGAAEAWTVSGLRDGVGVFTARFSWDRPKLLRRGTAPVLHRKVLRYAPSAHQEVENSLAEAAFSDGWIERVRAREKRSGSLGSLTAEVDAELEMERLSAGIAALSATDLPPNEAAFGFDFGGDETSLPAAASDPEPFAGDPVARLGELLDKLEVLASEGGLSGPEGYALWRELADLVRLRPAEVVPLFLESIRGGELDPAVMQWLTSSLGRAGAEGSPAAIAALAELIADPAAIEDVRLAALIASHQVGAAATPDMLQAVVDLLIAGDRLPAESVLPNAASLLLGTFAESGTLPFDEAVFELIRAESFARGDPWTYFEALANSERPQALDEMVSLLSKGDETVRRAAAETLGLLGDPRAQDPLVSTATSADAPAVRQAAIGSLGALEPTPEGTLALAGLAAGDADERIRAGAISALAAYAARGSTEAARVLELAATADPSPAVRDLAGQSLADLEERAVLAGLDQAEPGAS